MKLEPLLSIALALLILLAGCEKQPDATQGTLAIKMVEPTASSFPEQTAQLNVFAAASLVEAFSEIGKLFETAHPGVTVVFNFAGSQQLAQQINEGAPADVFASANKKQMDVVSDSGEVIGAAQQTFARNRLVVIFPQDNPGGLTNLEDLAQPGLKLVLASSEVPVGQYSLDFLDNASTGAVFGTDFKDKVLQNVVSYEENVKAVLTKVALGEADAGIVYTSDLSGQNAEKVERLDIPDALNQIASYPIAPIRASQNLELAQAFIEMVLSPVGQEILAKFHFTPVR